MFIFSSYYYEHKVYLNLCDYRRKMFAFCLELIQSDVQLIFSNPKFNNYVIVVNGKNSMKKIAEKEIRVSAVKYHAPDIQVWARR